MIDTYYCEVVHFKGTSISNVSHFEIDPENNIFEKFSTHQSSVVSFVDNGEMKIEECLISYNHV